MGWFQEQILRECLDTGDFVMIFALTLVLTLTGMLMTALTRALTGFVLESSNMRLLAGTAVFMISALLCTQLIQSSRQLMLSRIVIAHCLSTLQNCSRTLVLDDGQIREDGTYDELLAKNGTFARLFARQRTDA